MDGRDPKIPIAISGDLYIEHIYVCSDHVRLDTA